MVRATTAEFIAETPNAHGIYDQPEKTIRKLYVTVRSVGMTETYKAMSVGHYPEIVIILEHDFEYQGEKEIILNGTHYNVLRTYLNKYDQLEITLERSVHQYV